MKKVLVVLVLLPLFFCCNDETIEDWKERTYKVKIEVTGDPYVRIFCCHLVNNEKRLWQEKESKDGSVVYDVKPIGEEVAFVLEKSFFNGKKKNYPKITAKLYIDDKFIEYGKLFVSYGKRNVLRFVYNFKTKKVEVRHDRRE
ncbi:MAG: hypothetical protein KGV44_09260 [Flavobacteriaceae bacterium]|nr:hypothetical protein [Flavobacteriaceae bacterium]